MLDSTLTSSPARCKTKRARALAAALAITAVVVVAQLVLFHLYVGFRLDAAVARKLLTGGKWRADERLERALAALGELADLATGLGVQLVLVDEQLLARVRARRHQQTEAELATDTPSQRRLRQEARADTVVHLAIVNETSNGQPNIKRFADELRARYLTMQFAEGLATMQAEVYKLSAGQLDALAVDGLAEDAAGGRWRAHAPHNSQERPTDSLGPWEPHESEGISKVYTEFLTHVFVLAKSKREHDNDEPHEAAGGGKRLSVASQNAARKPAPIERLPWVAHIVVLYNFEPSPGRLWIQRALALDEARKHRLLAFDVHAFDFQLGIQNSYLHAKRPLGELADSEQLPRRLAGLKVFASPLNFANNSYVHCEPTNLALAGASHLTPAREPPDVERLADELATGVQFMDMFARAYGNFSFWLTGASLLSYYRSCELAAAGKRRGPPVSVEWGLFASEFDATAFNDLATAADIGVSLVSARPRGGATRRTLAFTLADCPHLIFRLFLYELRLDGARGAFFVSPPMTGGASGQRRRAEQDHTFAPASLQLCLTHLPEVGLFKVPCDAREHLQRIFAP